MLIDDLKFKFNIMKMDHFKIAQIHSDELSENYVTYCIKDKDRIGVAIEYNDTTFQEEEYLEKFENMELSIKTINYESQNHKILSLLTTSEENSDKFLLICKDFIEEGLNGQKREELLKTPEKWVENLKSLLGNKKENEAAYDILGELIVFKNLLKQNNRCILTLNGTYDIEADNKLYEVKSTVIKHASEIEIHSEFQLEVPFLKELKLEFIRLEPSIQGKSIDEIIEELKTFDINVDIINKKIKLLSTSVRKQKYRVLELREYDIDEKFPKITRKDFKNDEFPSNISKITYTIDLSGLRYRNIEII